MATLQDHYDVVIIGGGISGICASYYLNRDCPKLTQCVIERRSQLGGTWDLFRYPGIRSDSDMYTFGFPFNPWHSTARFGSGEDILQYMNDTAKKFSIDKRMVFNTSVTSAAWTDEAMQWSLSVADTAHEFRGLVPGKQPAPCAADGKSQDVEAPARLADKYCVEGTQRTITCRYIVLCTGYYSYTDPHWPTFPNQDKFKGQIIHPQFWDPKTDYKGKDVAIIGSGATAITLAPAMAKGGAKSVTVVQRSPTYMAPMPLTSPLFCFLMAYCFFIPQFIVDYIVRSFHIFQSWFYYWIGRRKPEQVKRAMLAGVKTSLVNDKKKKDVTAEEMKMLEEVMPHFTPSYKPWDQRVCVMPDGDLAKEVTAGRIKMVTATIDSITPTGLTATSKLGDGKEKIDVKADIIIPATGLKLQARGGMVVTINGQEADPGKMYTYRGAMMAHTPNFFVVFGYLNASWALKAVMLSEYTARLIRECEKQRKTGDDGRVSVTPRPKTMDDAQSVLFSCGFTSSYLLRNQDTMPKEGKEAPWRNYQNVYRDYFSLFWSSARDPNLEYKVKRK